MDVVFGGHRHVKIDHVAKRFHIDAACRNIGSHERLVHAVFEASERQRALRLRPIAVNTFGLDAVRDQLRGETIGAMLGAGEDQRLRHVAAFEQFNEQRALEVL